MLLVGCSAHLCLCNDLKNEWRNVSNVFRNQKECSTMYRGLNALITLQRSGGGSGSGSGAVINTIVVTWCYDLIMSNLITQYILFN